MKSSGRWGLGLLLALLGVVPAVPAGAQDLVEELAPPGNEGFDLHLYRPAMDSKGFFYTNGVEVLPANNISFGFVLDIGRNIAPTNPEREDRGADVLVQDAFQGGFTASYGLLNWAVLGVSVPIVLMSTNKGLNDLGPTGATYDTDQIATQKLSNVIFHGKLRLRHVRRVGPGVAVGVQLGVPTANADRDGAAEPGTWFWPRAMIEDRFFHEKFRIGVDAGLRSHTGSNAQFGLDSAGLPQLEHGELEYGDLATFGGALSYRVLQALDLVVETYGSQLLSDADSKQKLSQEFVGGVKLFTDGRSYLFLGAGSRAFSTGFQAAETRMVLGIVFEPSIGDRDGDGILDDKDKCPDEAEDRDGFEDEDGCPDPDNDDDGIPDDRDRCPNVPEDLDGEQDQDGCPETSLKDRDGDGILDIHDRCPTKREDLDGFEDDDGCPDWDNDQDGIVDASDKCPLIPEDKDGFEDEDGCPDNDNDNDQIPDAADQCPNEPENYNGHQDSDGCPEKGRVIVEGTDIIILEKVQFATNSAQILPESDPILDDVATTLKNHAEFGVVEVAGHADERGSDIHNLNLTKARAQSVMRALIQRGVAPDRLVSQGYGEYCPLDRANTQVAYEKNRRVEFKVVKTSGKSTGVQRGCEAANRAGITPPPVE